MNPMTRKDFKCIITLKKIQNLMKINDLDRIIDKPWGNFVKLTDNEKTTVKIISINAGNRTSLQFHEHRSEK